MSMFKVKVVDAEGKVLGFLRTGSLVRNENARWYHHPSGANAAASSYIERRGQAPSTVPVKCFRVDRDGVETEI